MVMDQWHCQGQVMSLSNSHVAIHWHAAMPPEYYWLSTKHMLEQKLSTDRDH
jgi:hypothetical protein